MAKTPLSAAEFLAKLDDHESWVSLGVASGTGQLRLSDCEITDITARERSLSSAEIVRAVISNSTFVGCDFSDCLFLEGVFRDCRFLSCTFRKADLRYVECSSVDFTGSDLTRADLRHAVVRGVNFTRCDLSWAWLVDTDLRGAVLEGVNLEGARLIRTKIYNTKKFALGSLHEAIVEDVDTTENASGSKASGVDVLSFLRKDA